VTRRAAARDEIEAITRDNTGLFPDWQSPAWGDWQPAAEVPGGIRFGTLAVGTTRFPGSKPTEMAGGAEPGRQLKPFGPAAIEVPALLPFPPHAFLVVQPGEGVLGPDDGQVAVGLPVTSTAPSTGR
jgi:hypothetical protein